MDFEGAFIDVEDYELTKKKLGEGSFGVVYVVDCLKDHVQYAAKIIPSDKLSKGNEQMMLIRESGILHKLHHPAIVKFIGINFHSFEDPTILSPTIITEYLENGSLHGMLKKTKAKPDEKWTPTKKYISLLGIADAMRYLHEQGILHRDLKPENVLLDHDYYPRVCDFGLSKCFSQGLTPSMQISMTGNIGSPLYMAPELFNDDDEVHHFTAGIDVYAFSMLAYQIATEKVPFETDGKIPSFMKFMKIIHDGTRPEITSDVTPKMKDLLVRCWSQEPTSRPSFGEIFDLLSSDFSYIKEKVDKKEVQSYISRLKDARKSSISARKSEKEKPAKSEPGEKEKPLETAPSKKSEKRVPLSEKLIDISDVKKEDEIGEGGFSKVYRATLCAKGDRQETECAMKVYKDKSDKFFLDLIDNQRLMDHVAVLPLIGFALPSERYDHYAIFTPLMENGSLDNLLKKVSQGAAPDNWETIKSICIFGVAAGMAYIHQRGVFHRDLKPFDIFLDGDYHPKIGGFSLSTCCVDDTKSSEPIGTPVYMAPEVFENGAYSSKMDVYSYSLVFYQLVTEKCNVYENCTFYQIYKRVLKGERPEFNGYAMPACEDLIRRCWSQDPDDRPSFIQIVKELIDNKEKFFDMSLIDEDELEIYIEDAIQGLDFSLA